MYREQPKFQYDFRGGTLHTAVVDSTLNPGTKVRIIAQSLFPSQLSNTYDINLNIDVLKDFQVGRWFLDKYSEQLNDVDRMLITPTNAFVLNDESSTGKAEFIYNTVNGPALSKPINQDIAEEMIEDFKTVGNYFPIIRNYRAPFASINTCTPYYGYVKLKIFKLVRGTLIDVIEECMCDSTSSDVIDLKPLPYKTFVKYSSILTEAGLIGKTRSLAEEKKREMYKKRKQLLGY